MSLAQITQKIEQDARDEAEKIQAAAREQETAIRRGAEKEIKNIEEAARARFEKERPEIFRRRGIVARLDVEKLHLGAKRKLIQDVFDEGLRRLQNLPKEDCLRFCESLLREAAAGGGLVMEISKGEKHIGPEWLEAFNSRNGKNHSPFRSAAGLLGRLRLKRRARFGQLLVGDADARGPGKAGARGREAAFPGSGLTGVI